MKFQLLLDDSPAGGVDSKLLFLTLAVLILCVLSFSVPPVQTNTVDRTHYYKTQYISLDGSKGNPS